ncbi:LPXTG cell wall anchor domain-containing protein [Dankookia rubra]|nr:LPXTG cell wall anchor domain-containing protein [Dankookia rubra]
MPQQNAERSTLPSTGHATGRLWLWAGLLAVLAGLAVVARMQVGIGYHFGDVAALALMASATFIILINQRGMPAHGEAEN